jgi:hypothetical protein
MKWFALSHPQHWKTPFTLLYHCWICRPWHFYAERAPINIALIKNVCAYYGPLQWLCHKGWGCCYQGGKCIVIEGASASHWGGKRESLRGQVRVIEGPMSGQWYRHDWEGKRVAYGDMSPLRGRWGKACCHLKGEGVAIEGAMAMTRVRASPLTHWGGKGVAIKGASMSPLSGWACHHTMLSQIWPIIRNTAVQSPIPSCSSLQEVDVRYGSRPGRPVWARTKYGRTCNMVRWTALNCGIGIHFWLVLLFTVSTWVFLV